MSKIGEVYVLPANTLVHSIQLQEMIRFEKDILVTVTNTCVGNDIVFATILVKFVNLALSFHTGTDMSSYMITRNEISVDFNKLKFVREYEFEDR